MTTDDNDINIDTEIPDSLSLTENSIGAVIPVPADPKPTVRQVRGKQQEARLKKAFERYLLNGDRSGPTETVFYTEIRAFAYNKMQYLADDPKEGFTKVHTTTIQTVDDYAQNVTLRVYRYLHTFKGDSFKAFITWLYKIVTRLKATFAQELIDNKYERTTLADEVTGDYGDVSDIEARTRPGRGVPQVGEDEDTPRLTTGKSRGGSGMPDYMIRLPKAIQGLDRDLFYFYVDGMRQKEIGRLVGLSENAVALRLNRLLSKKIPEERAREKEEAKLDWLKKKDEHRNGFARGLEKFRAQTKSKVVVL